MPQWEYQVWYLDASLEASSIRDQLERWGHDGWELVTTSVWDLDTEGGGRQLVGVFKRSAGSAELRELPIVRTLAPGSQGTVHETNVTLTVARDSWSLGQAAAKAVALEHRRDVTVSPTEALDEMIRAVEAELLAIRRWQVAADDESKQARATHLEAELHVLRQSRVWVKTDADVAWVRSGLEARRSAYALQQQRRLGWFVRLWDSGRRWSPTGRRSDSTVSFGDDFVDVDELRNLLEQTRGRKIRDLLAQECAAVLIARDPSRTDHEIEARLTHLAGRKVIGSPRIGIVRKRMEGCGVIPASERLASAQGPGEPEKRSTARSRSD